MPKHHRLDSLDRLQNEQFLERNMRMAFKPVRMTFRRMRQIDKMTRTEFAAIPAWEQALYLRTPMPPAQRRQVWAEIETRAALLRVDALAVEIDHAWVHDRGR
jgi:hypothetical protein